MKETVMCLNLGNISRNVESADHSSYYLQVGGLVSSSRCGIWCELVGGLQKILFHVIVFFFSWRIYYKFYKGGKYTIWGFIIQHIKGYMDERTRNSNNILLSISKTFRDRIERKKKTSLLVKRIHFFSNEWNLNERKYNFSSFFLFLFCYFRTISTLQIFKWRLFRVF